MKRFVALFLVAFLGAVAYSMADDAVKADQPKAVDESAAPAGDASASPSPETTPPASPSPAPEGGAGGGESK